MEQRERLETQAIQNYAEAKQAVNDAQCILSDLKELRRELIEVLSVLRLAGSIDPQEQLIYQDYIRQVKHDIVKQEKQIAELASRAERMRIHLVDASQNRQVIDKMKRTGIEAHRLDHLRREQSDSDELASTRHQYKADTNRAA